MTVHINIYAGLCTCKIEIDLTAIPLLRYIEGPEVYSCRVLIRNERRLRIPCHEFEISVHIHRYSEPLHLPVAGNLDVVPRGSLSGSRLSYGRIHILLGVMIPELPCAVEVLVEAALLEILGQGIFPA